jgi:hypothetical protein
VVGARRFVRFCGVKPNGPASRDHGSATVPIRPLLFRIWGKIPRKAVLAVSLTTGALAGQINLRAQEHPSSEIAETSTNASLGNAVEITSTPTGTKAFLKAEMSMANGAVRRHSLAFETPTQARDQESSGHTHWMKKENFEQGWLRTPMP